MGLIIKVIIGLCILLLILQFIPMDEYNNCLEDVAKNYCLSNDMEYSHVANIGHAFYCLEDRQYDKFYFTQKEVEDCLK